MIRIKAPIQKLLTTDAVQSYPDECCGFLFGQEREGHRTVTGILVVDNSKEGDKRRRFEVSPKDYMKAERYASENNVALLGVYHSHPDHPAIPSEHDRVAAQPYFSYVIVSVVHRRPAEIRSWRLNEVFHFEEEFVTNSSFVHN